ncbi:MAG TPA: heavy metal translocating P-type ATPase [Terriglobia bacterium]|nr:heavy metal translocating P-type ATPase [Terriglobia bacterium]
METSTSTTLPAATPGVVPPGKVVPARAPRRFSKEDVIAVAAVLGIAVSLFLRFLLKSPRLTYDAPLFVVLFLGGGPLVYDLIREVLRRQFGADLLAGISIITSVVLGEYLAGSLVVLMLSGGKALESYAVRSASSVLEALAKRMPTVAHAKRDGAVADIPISEIKVGDFLVVYPHEACPVDGTVLEGHGSMDESYLTGEPFVIAKTPGSQVLSGALNGETALTIQANKLAVDSRYANITRVMREAQLHRPSIRRLGDQLGTYYTPLAMAVAVIAWLASGNPDRFLGVLVVATPCPLLIAIPVSIIGSITLAAKRGIVIKDPSILEQLDSCRTIIFDKTGTLTYGMPHLTEQIVAEGFDPHEVLRLVASVEQYSRHPLAGAVVEAARRSNLVLTEASEMTEPPGQGLNGIVSGRRVHVTSRRKLVEKMHAVVSSLPPAGEGLECMIAIDGVYAAAYRFRDAPRHESRPFIAHLGRKHQFDKVMLVSGDRESEVRYLAERVGVKTLHASVSPEEKVAIVRQENQTAKTLFLGDGINDAPALMAANIGIAFGQGSDITAEAAGAVIMEASLASVDELFHIARRMRWIAIQSAVGGMILSVVGMAFAAGGTLPPVGGAIAQEIIDVLAIANALRAALPPKTLVDF